MSKTGWIILSVCLCVVFCICAGVFLAGRIANSLFSKTNDSSVDVNTTKGYKDLNNPYSEDGTYSIQIDELKKLEIDWISGSVAVELTDGDLVVIREVSNKTISAKNALRYGLNENTLRVQACKKNYGGKLPRKDLTISLPRSLAAGMKECEFNTVSASVSADDLGLDELEINTVSGRVNLEHLVADEASVNSVSGKVDMYMCGFESLRLDSVSGEAQFSGEAHKIKGSSVSGKFDFTLKVCREIKISTMSGDITLALAGTPREVQIDTTSGTTRLTLPKDASCTIDIDSMSGKLYLNDETVSGKHLSLGDGTADYDFDTMSGSVYVYTK